MGIGFSGNKLREEDGEPGYELVNAKVTAERNEDWGSSIMLSDIQVKLIFKFWKNIAEFESGEIQAWNSDNDLNTEARVQERVKAYSKLFDKFLDKEFGK